MPEDEIYLYPGTVHIVSMKSYLIQFYFYNTGKRAYSSITISKWLKYDILFMGDAKKDNFSYIWLGEKLYMNFIQ